MKKISAIILLCLSLPSIASQFFKDNADIAIVLSDSNYNRLVVRGDKITQAHFPEHALSLKNEDDGSLYVMPIQQEPFTLFLTTEAGHHFSTTVGTEHTLGKTIEFIAHTPIEAAPKKPAPKIRQDVTVLMTHLIAREKVDGFDIKHHFNQVIRLPQGLVLIPKLTYSNASLIGEVTEIYNGSNTSLFLNEALFQSQGVKAVSFSKKHLNVKERGMVYRVLEVGHGALE